MWAESCYWHQARAPTTLYEDRGADDDGDDEDDDDDGDDDEEEEEEDSHMMLPKTLCLS